MEKFPDLAGEFDSERSQKEARVSGDPAHIGHLQFGSSRRKKPWSYSRSKSAPQGCETEHLTSGYLDGAPLQSKAGCMYQGYDSPAVLYKRPEPQGCETPASTTSYCSSDAFLEGNCSVWSYRPPSSIHLRDSIENYLDMNLRTPDNIDSPEGTPFHRRSERNRKKWTSEHSGHYKDLYTTYSAANLQSQFECRRFLEQCGFHQRQDSVPSKMQLEHHHLSQDSMTFSTESELSLDNLGRSPKRLLRSNSDSLTSGLPRDLSFPSGYESAESADRACGRDRKHGMESGSHVTEHNDTSQKVQTLLHDIHDLCMECSD